MNIKKDPKLKKEEFQTNIRLSQNYKNVHIKTNEVDLMNYILMYDHFKNITHNTKIINGERCIVEIEATTTIDYLINIINKIKAGVLTNEKIRKLEEERYMTKRTFEVNKRNLTKEEKESYNQQLNRIKSKINNLMNGNSKENIEGAELIE